MGLEAVTFISDLVITNPVGAVDPKSQGDDHIRNIKKALRNSFPNFAGVAMTLTEAQLNEAARLSVGNVFTGTPQEVRHATGPELLFHNTGAASGLKKWAFQGETDGDFTLFTRNDAGGAVENAMQVRRNSLSEVTAFNLFADTITLNGVNVANYALLNGANTFTFDQLISKASPFYTIRASTATDALVKFDTNGANPRGYFGAPGVNGNLITGSVVGDIGLRVPSGGFLFSGNDGTTAHLKLSSAGLVTTPNADPAEVGYAGLPPNSKTSNYTCVLTDANKNILCTTTPGFTVTIPANSSVAYPVGTTLAITNITGGNISIAITTDSMALAGTTTTGTRTLAHNGEATLHKVTTTAWTIAGAGLS